MTDNPAQHADYARERILTGLNLAREYNGGGLITLIVHHPDGTRAYDIQAFVPEDSLTDACAFDQQILQPVCEAARDRVNRWASEGQNYEAGGNAE